MPDDMREEIASIVSRYRPHDFFTAEIEQPRGDELGFLHAPLDLPAAAFGGMSAEEVAEVLASYLKTEYGEDGPGEVDDRLILSLDLHRMYDFDCECAGPDENGYVDVLLAMGRISRGAFAPTEIEEEWQEDEGRVLVSFRQNGTLHSLPAAIASDWLDTSIVPRINALLPPGAPRFVAVREGGQRVFLLALTAAERAAMETAGWAFWEDADLVENVARKAGQAFEREIAQKFASPVYVVRPADRETTDHDPSYM